jgi:glycosyltransferase involved in cell wall biosynthesis
MKIALIVPGFSADEDDWCIPALRNLVATLARTDEIVVLALRYPYRAARYTAFGARIIALGGAQARGLTSAAIWRKAVTALHAEHRRRPIDALHAFWATEAGAIAAVAGRLLRIGSIVSLAGGELAHLPDIGYGDQLARAQRAKVRLALRLASHVTAGSRFLLDLAAPHLRHLPTARVHHLPLGIDTALFTPPHSPGSSLVPRTSYSTRHSAPGTRHWSLVHAASLVPVKAQATLLHAVAHLHQHGHPATLTIAGEGPEEPRLRHLAASLGITGAITFLGAVPHDHLPTLYQSGDLFVLTSRHEAQGMAPLEAAACGLPVVGTAVGILPELALDAATTVPTGDPAALADAIAAILTNPTRLAAMRVAARALTTDRYSLPHTAVAFRALYHSLSNRPTNRPDLSNLA